MTANDPLRRRRVVGTATEMLWLGPAGQRVRLSARFRWCSDDPWAVAVTFGAAPGTTWLLGLELLVIGCARPAGRGDVTLRPQRDGPDGRPGVAELTLSAPSGSACFELRLAALQEFLDRIARGRLGRAAYENLELALPWLTLWTDTADDELAQLAGDHRLG